MGVGLPGDDIGPPGSNGVGSGDGCPSGGGDAGSSVVDGPGVEVGEGSSSPSEAVDMPVTTAVGVGEPLGVGDCWPGASGDSMDGSMVGDGVPSTDGTPVDTMVGVTVAGVDEVTTAVGDGVKPFHGGQTTGARGVVVGIGSGGSTGVASPNPAGQMNLPSKT